MTNSKFIITKLDLFICLVMSSFIGLIFINYNFQVKDNIAKDKYISQNFIYSPITMKVQPARDEMIYAGICGLIMEGNSNGDNVKCPNADFILKNTKYLSLPEVWAPIPEPTGYSTSTVASTKLYLINRRFWFAIVSEASLQQQRL